MVCEGGRSKECLWRQFFHIFFFFFNYEFQQSRYFELFFHSVHFNFINLKLEKNTCKKWGAGHRNTCIFRSTFRVSLCTAVSCRLPSIQKTRGTSSCLLRERASKSRHPAPQKTKTNSAPWTSGSYLCWTTWSFSLPLILQVRAALFLLIKALSEAKFKPSDSTKYHLLAKLTL